MFSQHMAWLSRHTVRLGSLTALTLMSSMVLLSTADSAINTKAPAIYRELHIVSPIQNPPIDVPVSAGGPINARELEFQAGCTGFFNPDAPHVRVHYKSKGKPLQFYVQSAADTTLIVRTPKGAWRCDDDSFAKNPAVRIADAPSGSYEVWVGAFGGGRPAATLFIKE